MIDLKALREAAEKAISGVKCGNCIHQKACQSMIHTLYDDSPCDFDPPKFFYKPFSVHPSTVLALVRIAEAAKDVLKCDCEACKSDLQEALAELENGGGHGG